MCRFTYRATKLDWPNLYICLAYSNCKWAVWIVSTVANDYCKILPVAVAMVPEPSFKNDYSSRSTVIDQVTKRTDKGTECKQFSNREQPHIAWQTCAIEDYCITRNNTGCHITQESTMVRLSKRNSVSKLSFSMRTDLILCNSHEWVCRSTN